MMVLRHRRGTWYLCLLSTSITPYKTMKNLTQTLKKIALLALFAASTTLLGCNAADLTGPADAPQQQGDCQGSECSNGRNL